MTTNAEDVNTDSILRLLVLYCTFNSLKISPKRYESDRNANFEWIVGLILVGIYWAYVNRFNQININEKLMINSSGKVIIFLWLKAAFTNLTIRKVQYSNTRIMGNNSNNINKCWRRQVICIIEVFSLLEDLIYLTVNIDK